MKNNEEMLKKFPTMKSQGSAKNEANNVAQTAAAAPAETAKVDFSNVKVEPLFEERLISIHSANLISVP